MVAMSFLQNWFRAHLKHDWANKRCVAARYATGDGVNKNEARARIWYARAAKAGDVTALYDLGMMLILGEGGPVDEPGGQAMLLDAANQGDPEAQKVLTYAFTDGLYGFPVEPPKANHWRRLAESQGMQV